MFCFMAVFVFSAKLVATAITTLSYIRQTVYFFEYYKTVGWVPDLISVILFLTGLAYLILSERRKEQ